MQHPEPGWYPDPVQSGQVRYFDGDDWTDDIRATAPSEATASGLPPGQEPQAGIDATTARAAGDDPATGGRLSPGTGGSGGVGSEHVGSGRAADGRQPPTVQGRGGRSVVVIVGVVVMVLLVAGSVYLGSLADGDEPGVASDTPDDAGDEAGDAEADDPDAGDDAAAPDAADDDAAAEDDEPAASDDGADDAASDDGDDPGSSADDAGPDAPGEDDDGATPTADGSAAELEPAERDGMYDAPFERTIDPAASYLATIVTSQGDIVVELDPEGAPLATNNLVNLARDGFYDQVTFHRVIEGFVIQGGDPSGTGAGGPGYRFEDELEPAQELVAAEGGYPRGTLAMANAGPDTNGSQFFIAHGEVVELAPDYTVFGEVVDGIEVVDAIATTPTSAADRPSTEVTITTIEIEES